MESRRYQIVYDGTLAEGKSREAVREALATLFRKPAEQMDILFSGKTQVIKKGLTGDHAQQYITAMANAGAIARIQPLEAPGNTGMVQQPLDTQAISSAFRGEVRPVEVKASYKLSLAIVALGMIVLPILYFGITIASGWLLYWHATENLSLFREVNNGYGALLAYSAPLVAGAALFILMTRPFIDILRARQGKNLTLKAESEPVLFGFIEHICHAVRAPVPAEVCIDNQVNASAGFRRGLRSFIGSDLTLTLGLPLVAGFNTRQLAGVLAHEFGHFSQGAGLRFYYIIQTINHWFVNAVYRRGWLEQKLEQWSDSNLGFLSLPAAFARLTVWLVRKLLWVFMMAGHALSSNMSRQMEFDADRYEARLAGSDQFGNTAMQLKLLAVAYDEVFDDLYHTWQQHGQLVDNLPAAVADKQGGLSQDIHDQLEQQIQEGETGTYDSHPCDRERISSARQEQADGIFHLEAPATTLFRDFDTAAQRVTLHHYQETLELGIEPSQLVTLSESKQDTEEMERQREANTRYIGQLYFYLPLSLPELASPGVESTALKQEWETLYRRQQATRKQFEDLAEEWNRIDDKFYEMLQGLSYLQMGFKVKHKEFGFKKGTVNAAHDALEVQRQQLAGALERTRAHLEIAGQRLVTTLSLIADRPRTGELASIIIQDDCIHSLMTLIQRISGLIPAYSRLREYRFAIGCVLDNFEDAPEEEKALKYLQAVGDAAKQELLEIRSQLADLSYPFEHSDGEILLGQYLFHEAVEETPGTDIAGDVDLLTERSVNLYFRVLGMLAMAAEQVEQHYGLTTSSDEHGSRT